MYEGVKLLADEVLSSHQVLLHRSPQSIAAGMIWYYIRVNGIQIPLTKVAGITKVAEAAIPKMSDLIATAHNSD